jgi:hypothetical protein
MITITLPEFKNFNIYRDRFGYTVRKHWVTSKGKSRNDVVGCSVHLIGALNCIEKYLKEVKYENGSFTIEDLKALKKELGVANEHNETTLDKYRRQIKAYWTSATYNNMSQINERLSELNSFYKNISEDLFDFEVFKTTRMSSLKSGDSFNFVVKSFYYNAKGELKIKESWTRYPSNLSSLVDTAIKSEVYSLLDNNTVDINTYIATNVALIEAFCSEFDKTYMKSVA